jgi:hypothetical protein
MRLRTKGLKKDAVAISAVCIISIGLACIYTVLFIANQTEKWKK